MEELLLKVAEILEELFWAPIRHRYWICQLHILEIYWITPDLDILRTVELGVPVARGFLRSRFRPLRISPAVCGSLRSKFRLDDRLASCGTFALATFVVQFHLED